MPGRECFHCKQWIEEGAPHDCWTTAEAALMRDLSEDLQDASRKVCYFFVRPRKTALEVCFFLGRRLKAPQVKRMQPTSRARIARIVHLRHRDEVEPPITDWLEEAYRVSPTLTGKPPVGKKTRRS